MTIINKNNIIFINSIRGSSNGRTPGFPACRRLGSRLITMKYYVYILISAAKSNWSYVGQTDDINRRIKEHNSGKVRSTKGYMPLKCIYCELFSQRKRSLAREKYLKSGIGRDEKYTIITKNH